MRGGILVGVIVAAGLCGARDGVVGVSGCGFVRGP